MAQAMLSFDLTFADPNDYTRIDKVVQPHLKKSPHAHGFTGNGKVEDLLVGVKAAVDELNKAPLRTQVSSLIVMIIEN